MVKLLTSQARAAASWLRPGLERGQLLGVEAHRHQGGGELPGFVHLPIVEPILELGLAVSAAERVQCVAALFAGANRLHQLPLRLDLRSGR